MPFPIQRTFKLNSDGRCEMFTPEYYMSRSQDLEEAYQDAGQFYWTNRSRQKNSPNSVMFSDISIPLILPRYLVQDIDTLEDWTRAEYMYKALKEAHSDKELETIDDLTRVHNKKFLLKQGKNFIAKCKKEEILKGMDDSLVKQELEAAATDQIKGRFVSVGSLEEVSTGGNWPPSYDKKERESKKKNKK